MIPPVVASERGTAQKYALEIFLSSVEGVISLWIAGGAQEEPEEITQMILATYNYDYWKS